MLGNSSPAFKIGKLQGSAELEERVPAHHGCEEGRIGFEDRVDLSKEGWEVVDPMDREGREDGIKGVWFVGDGFQGVEGLKLDWYGRFWYEVAMEKARRGLGAD
jgi:hypothetical protein